MNGRQVREVELFAMLLAERQQQRGRQQSPEEIEDALMSFARTHNARFEKK